MGLSFVVDLIWFKRRKETLRGGDRDFESLVVLDINNCLAIYCRKRQEIYRYRSQIEVEELLLAMRGT